MSFQWFHYKLLWWWLLGLIHKTLWVPVQKPMKRPDIYSEVNLYQKQRPHLTVLKHRWGHCHSHEQSVFPWNQSKTMTPLLGNWCCVVQCWHIYFICVANIGFIPWNTNESPRLPGMFMNTWLHFAEDEITILGPNAFNDSEPRTFYTGSGW